MPVRLQERRLLLLVSVHSESLLPLMGRNLMLLSFLSARHSDAPYPIGFNIVITATLSRFSPNLVKCLKKVFSLFEPHCGKADDIGYQPSDRNTEEYSVRAKES